MDNMHYMVAYRVELTDGTIHRGTVAVPADTADAACRAVAGLIRGRSLKYGRPDCFSGFDPAEVDDISVQSLGLASRDTRPVPPPEQSPILYPE